MFRDCRENRIENEIRNEIENEIKRRYMLYLMEILENKTIEDFEQSMTEEQFRMIAIKQIAKEMAWKQYQVENNIQFDPDKRITKEYINEIENAKRIFETQFEIIWTSTIS